jgi:hypothetical protein
MSELAKAKAKAKKIVDAAKIKAKARINAVTVKAAIALEKAKMKVGNAANAKTIINALKAKSKIAIAAIKEKCSIAVNTAIIKAKKYLNSKKKKGGEKTEDLSIADESKFLAATKDATEMRALYINQLIYENSKQELPEPVFQNQDDKDIITRALVITTPPIPIARLVERFLKREIESTELINNIYAIQDLNLTIKKIIRLYITDYQNGVINAALSLPPNRSAHTLQPGRALFKSTVTNRIPF